PRCAGPEGQLQRDRAADQRPGPQHLALLDAVHDDRHAGRPRPRRDQAGPLLGLRPQDLVRTTVARNMTAGEIEDLRSIFVDPVAYADPVSWHAAAARIRDEAPILRVRVPGYPEFWAITKHADVMEIERQPEIFTNAPVAVLGPTADLQAADDLPVKTLIQM